jgi:hypothetical protein
MSRVSKTKAKPKVLIELRASGISGIGVFAVSDIPKGQKVADGLYAADFEALISWHIFTKLDSTVQKKVNDFCIGTAEGFVPLISTNCRSSGISTIHVVATSGLIRREILWPSRILLKAMS